MYANIKINVGWSPKDTITSLWFDADVVDSITKNGSNFVKENN